MLTYARLIVYSFFFNDPAPTEIYTLSLHDALPIRRGNRCTHTPPPEAAADSQSHRDRKSTRLNSSHVRISYAVFCLKKKTSGVSGFSSNWKEPSLVARTAAVKFDLPIITAPSEPVT